MTNTFEAVERLRADLALLTADLETKSRIAAVSGVETGDSMADAAREIVEVREQLRLKRMALREAERRHDAEKAEAEKALRDADRERCCELTDEIEKPARRSCWRSSVRAKHYERLYELESSLRVAGRNGVWLAKGLALGLAWREAVCNAHGRGLRQLFGPQNSTKQLANGNKATRLTDPAHVYSSLIHSASSGGTRSLEN